MAQLVARLVRNEKVGGSNPPSSTTGRHPIRMSVFCMPGRVRAVPVVVLLVAPLVFRAPAGPGCGAGPLCVPVGGGPPASRLRRELRSARRREARPGPAAGHGDRSQALLRPPAPSIPAALWCCVADVPGQAPPPPFTPVRPGVLVCSERHLDAWTGPAAAHSTAAMPSGPSGVLHTGNAWSADVRLGASPRSPARPRRRHHPRLGRRNLLQRTPPHHPLPQHLGLTPQPTRFVL